jgi:uridine kinase
MSSPNAEAAGRAQVLAAVVGVVSRRSAAGLVRVGIDGVDGAGKTYFADELAARLNASGRPTIRASIDGFHNPKAIRYRRGRGSPEGFFHDSYDYGQLKAVLLDPLGPGGTGRYRTAVFDHRADEPVQTPVQQASPGDILIVDGIFLHRPELRAYWDYSVFLEVAFDIAIPRGAQRGEGSADARAPENRRYVEGQKLYLRTCEPKRFATMTINNDDLLAPYVVEPA